MANNEKSRGWLKLLAWGFIAIAIVIIGRHFLFGEGLANISTAEWIIAAAFGLAGEIMLWIPKKRKQAEN